MSFADQLLQKHQALFTKATTHKFTTELCNGTLSDDRLLVYLIQDLKFFQVGLRLTCKAASLCDDDQAQIKLAKQIGFFANNENDYFSNCISQLSATTSQAALQTYQTAIIPKVETYVAYLKQLLDWNSYSYKQIVTALYLMEAVYLKWAKDAIDANLIPEDLEYKYKEWVDLHSGPIFEPWVDFLKEEVDRVGDSSVEQIFIDMCKLEYEFFEACYTFVQ